MITWQRLMILTALGGLTLVPALPMPAYEPAVAPWQVAQASGFSSASGRFAVAFPENPSRSREMDDINGDPIEIYEFSVETIGNKLSKSEKSQENLRIVQNSKRISS